MMSCDKRSIVGTLGYARHLLSLKNKWRLNRAPGLECSPAEPRLIWSALLQPNRCLERHKNQLSPGVAVSLGAHLHLVITDRPLHVSAIPDGKNA